MKRNTTKCRDKDKNQKHIHQHWSRRRSAERAETMLIVARCTLFAERNRVIR